MRVVPAGRLIKTFLFVVCAKQKTKANDRLPIDYARGGRDPALFLKSCFFVDMVSFTPTLEPISDEVEVPMGRAYRGSCEMLSPTLRPIAVRSRYQYEWQYRISAT